jgi:acetolactate synthase I/II/III large subunit
MNGAQVIVKMLQEHGVEVVFGVPGDTSIALYEALHDAAPEITHILARDERSAAFMADAYARLSHKPGVCECPSGAGALYSVPGVAEANASSIPVILLTSDNALAGEGKKTITELDTEALFKTITKLSTLLKMGHKLPETIRRAFRIATSGRPGAVQIAIPSEVSGGEYTGAPEALYPAADCCTYPSYRTRGSREALEELVGHLMQASRPVIVAGGGTNHSQAGDEIKAAAEWLAAPVVTTISGQGIMPDEHPLALGVIGDNGFHPHAIRAVEEADVILYVGCKMGSVSTLKWTLPSYNPERKILQIDLDPELLSNNFRNTLSVAGDARLVLADLVVLLRGRGAARKPSAWLDDLNEARVEFWRDAEAELQADDTPLKPQRVISALNKRLTGPSIVISDAGTPTPYITRFLKLGGNGSRFIIPRAYGGLGYAIPALVGAHQARPDARLVGLFGDGSLGMSAGELETLARLKIPAVLIHFNNSCFGWIKALQSLHAKSKYFSVDFTAGNPSMVAQGFGLKARQVATPEELEAGLDEAFASEGPFFLDVISESEELAIPPVASWLKAAEKLKKSQ